MATQAQITANWLNAQKSTGPRTPEGKAKVSQNAVKHGLLAEHSVVRGEDPEAFEAFRAEMLAELAPVGVLETMLAERVVGLSWRLRRAERFQNQAFDYLYLVENADPSYQVSKTQRRLAEAEQDNLVSGQVIVRDFADGKTFERLLMYERRIEQSLYRAMAELERLRKLRRCEPPTEEDSPGSAEEPVCQTKPNDTTVLATTSEGAAPVGGGPYGPY